MKSAVIRAQGPPENLQLTELPTPAPQAGQVLVKVGAAGVNPIDTYLRAGSIPMPVTLPWIPGCDFAGTVVDTGAGVMSVRAGDRVWGSNQGLFGRQGTLSEFACVAEEWVYPTPAGMSDEQAAAGALTGITAHLGLFLHAGLRPGELVFVNGGSGGVGTMVIQFAKAAGAFVATTAGAQEKRDLCRRLGADLVLDYRDTDMDARLKEFAAHHGGISIWWETQREPDLPRAIGMMRRRGRIILMAGRQAQPTFPLGPFYVNDLKMVGFAMFNAGPAEQRACAEQMNGWFAEGKWKPHIGHKFPLSQAAAAHRLQEENTLQNSGTLTGKIVVVPE